MKATNKEIAEFHAEFTKHLSDLCDAMLEYRDKMCKITLIEEDVKYKHDYKQFGKAGFKWKVKLFIESMEAGDNIMDQVKDLINDKYQ